MTKPYRNTDKRHDMQEIYFMIAMTVIFTVFITGAFIHLICSKMYKKMPRWTFVWIAVFTIVIWIGDIMAFSSFLMN